MTIHKNRPFQKIQIDAIPNKQKHVRPLESPHATSCSDIQIIQCEYSKSKGAFRFTHMSAFIYNIRDVYYKCAHMCETKRIHNI